jgi:hypothetical protein
MLGWGENEDEFREEFEEFRREDKWLVEVVGWFDFGVGWEGVELS